VVRTRLLAMRGPDAARRWRSWECAGHGHVVDRSGRVGRQRRRRRDAGAARADHRPASVSAQPLDERQDAGVPSLTLARGADRPLPAEAMGVTEADLAEGRAGRLSRRQRRSLVRRAALDALAWGLGAVVGGGLLVVPAVWSLADLVAFLLGGDSQVVGDSLGTLFVAGPFSLITVLGLWTGVADSRTLLDQVNAVPPRTTRSFGRGGGPPFRGVRGAGGWPWSPRPPPTPRA
jgi:hypothetical protein